MNVTDDDPAAQRLIPLHEGFRPLHDRVLVRRLAQEPFIGGKPILIIMPETAVKPSRRGLVVAVGPGKRAADGFRRPLDVKPGQIVQFGRFTDFDDGNLLLIQEADIVGIVE